MITRIAKITALCLAFIVVAGISAYLMLTFLIKSEDTVIVPDFIGKDVEYDMIFGHIEAVLRSFNFSVQP